jgi:hypothetical protein
MIHSTSLLTEAYFDKVSYGNSRYSHNPRVAYMLKLQMKTMLIMFFDIKCIVNFEFTAQDQTVNQAYYVEILEQLHGVVQR